MSVLVAQFPHKRFFNQLESCHHPQTWFPVYALRWEVVGWSNGHKLAVSVACKNTGIFKVII